VSGALKSVIRRPWLAYFVKREAHLAGLFQWFRFRSFEFVWDFDIRISDLPRRVCHAHHLSRHCERGEAISRITGHGARISDHEGREEIINYQLSLINAAA